MDLKEGMYVRTLTLSRFSRIGKLEKIDDICITDNGAVDKTQIIKVSHNIIDLIEAGDYVNGEKVAYINDKRELLFCTMMKEHNSNWINEEDIKSIVTKEQFSQMEYKVGD